MYLMNWLTGFRKNICRTAEISRRRLRQSRLRPPRAAGRVLPAPALEALESRALLTATSLAQGFAWPQGAPGAISQAAVNAALGTLTTTGRADVFLNLDAIAVTSGGNAGGSDSTINTVDSGPLIRLDDFRADARFPGIDGSGFAVVIIDTGIDLNHPFFGPDLNGDSVSDRIVFSYDFSGANDPDASDSHGHGSNVSSIAASSDPLRTGMAPGANIIHLKVFPDGTNPSATYADIEEALQWVVVNAGTYNVASVNLSLGSGNVGYHVNNQSYSDEYAALAGLNIIVTVAAGNNFYSAGSVQGLNALAAHSSVVSVGAVYDANIGSVTYGDGSVASTTGADRMTPFSQRDEYLLDVLAPGAAITGANQSGGVVTYHGTSQAAPHIAGIAALAQELAVQTLGRRLTVDEFKQLLRDSATIINDGDNENDNVVNTGLDFPRVDMLALGTAILALKPASLSGTVFHDLDGDGFDNGEPGLSGWTIYLDSNNNGSLDAATTTVAATSVPVALADVDTRRSLEVVTGLPGVITDVNVSLDMTHSWDEDIQVYLVSPAGTRIELFTNVGGSGDNFTGTLLDDEAPISITAASAPFTGNFRPEESLAALDGQNPNGTWILEISDDAASDVGILNSWSLTISSTEVWQTTPASGAFAFTGLAAGSYIVRQTPQIGWTQTSPGLTGSYTLNLQPGDAVVSRDFGNRTAPDTLEFISPASVSRDENSTSVITVQAAQAGVPSGAITYTLTGGVDQAKFTLTPQGQLAFATAPDFEHPADDEGDNRYLLEVTANNGSGGLVTQLITVTVNDVAETDVRVLSVVTNGATTLTVTYEIDTIASDPFTLGIYRSADSLAGDDLLLASLPVSSAADLTVGTHVKSWTIGSAVGQVPLPGAGAEEIDADYYLLAVADPDNSLVENDLDSLNEDNTAVLTGVYHPGTGSVMVQGSAGPDTLSVSGSIAVSLNGATYTYSTTTVSAVRVRTHGGEDLVNLTALSKPSLVLAGGGNDTVTGGSASDTLWGGAGDDALTGNGGNDTLGGEAGNDLATGGAGNDLYRFAADSDLGSDTLNESGGGNDTLDFSGTVSLGVTVNLGVAALQVVNPWLSLTLGTTTAIENVTGGAQADSLTGNSSANLLIGGPGHDVLAGGAGNDTYLFDADSPLGSDTLIEAPGGGTDLLNFSATTTRAVMVDLSLVAPQLVNANLTLTLSHIDGIENLTGGSLADSLTGNSVANILTGGPGNDSLAGGDGDDQYRFATNSPLGHDTIVESTGGGIDTVDFTGSTTRTVTLSLASDQTQVVNSNLSLTLSASDLIENAIGGNQNDTLVGNTLANLLNGGSGSDTLNGAEGNDTLIGAAGNDLLDGGAGNDVYSFDADKALGSDVLTEAVDAGTDLLDFSATTGVGIVLDLGLTTIQTVNANLKLTLSSDAAFEMILGTSKNDTLRGNTLANVLLGGAGIDTLFGLAGRDLLAGGTGADTLRGGDGDDILISGTLAYYNETTKVFNQAAIHAILAEWVRTDVDFSTRITHLKTGTGLNGSSVLSSGTVLTDGTAIDALFGELDLDWFWAFGSDTSSDLNLGGAEFVN